MNSNYTTLVHMDSAKRKLDLAVRSKTNMILYGPGGFGKSELITSYLESKKISYNIVGGFQNMPVDALMGIPDIDKFMNKSEFKIAFEKSPFVGAKVLILEEFMDVLPETAAAFKDILSAGGYRYKNKLYKSDIELVLIATNKSPEEIEDNDSIKAFYNERFPIHFKVDWEYRSADKYYNLFKAKLTGKLEEEELKVLSFICEQANPSPRIALKVAKVYLLDKNIEDITNINGFEHLSVKDLQFEIDSKIQITKLNTNIKKLLKLTESNRDNYSVLLYLKEEVDKLSSSSTIGNKYNASLFTLQNSINLKIINIENTFKKDIDKDLKNKIDEISGDFKL